MIAIDENVSLKPFNTFGVDVSARYFCRISSVEQLEALVDTPVFRHYPHRILGEGSNMLFTKDFDGMMIKMEIMGIQVDAETEDHITLTVGAGESWHGLVMHCVANNWGGVENLSLIPGTCGAAPIQNIGAYGVEIKNQIEKVSTMEVATGVFRTFQNAECQFDYRESVFKLGLKEKYFISSITLTLTKKNHVFNVGYGALKDTLAQHGVMNENDFTVKAISDAVIEIRKQKLPDVNVLGSAGSFFKNPLITEKQFDILREAYPKIPFYHSANQYVKIPAGWLIEQCGWKGKRVGRIGVHEHQALVIVNYGGGSGEEIFQLATMIRASVNEKFNVLLESEVNIL